MFARRQVFAIAWISAVAFCLSGCGGGGGGSVPQTAHAPFAPNTASGATGSASFVIAVANAQPAGSTSARALSAVVALTGVNGSVPTQSVPRVVVNLAAGSKQCVATATGLSCTATIVAPAGNDTFGVTTYTALNGVGTAIASSTASSVIEASGQTTCTESAPPARMISAEFSRLLAEVNR